MRKSAKNEFKHFDNFRKLLIKFFMISIDDNLLKQANKFKELIKYWMKFSDNQVEYFITEVLVKDFTRYHEVVENIQNDICEYTKENHTYPAQILFSLLESLSPTRATEFLLSYVDDITKIKKDFIGRSILHVAAKNAYAVAALKLILQDENLDIDQLNEEKQSALCIAIESENSEAVEEIVISSNGAVNTVNLGGDSLAHIAIDKGNILSLNALLKCKAIDLHALNSMEQTPFHLALQKSDNKIFQMLIQHKECNTAELNKHAGTLLHEAISHFNYFAFIALLNKKDFDINALDYGGITPLCKAIYMQNNKFAKKLLEHPKIDVNMPNMSRNKYLRMNREIHSINEELFFIDEELFAQNNRTLKENLQKDDGFTPLHYACYDDAEDIILLLVANGASFGVDSESLVNPLDLLLHNSSADSALRKTLSLITTVVGNKKCISYFSNMVEMFEKILINAYCMEYYDSLLNFIIANAIPHKIQFEYDHDIKSQNIQNVYLFFTLHALTRFEIDYAEYATEMLKYLLQKTKLLEIDAHDIFGNPPLYYACSNSDIEFVSLMIKNGANPNISFYNKRNGIAETPLHRACYENNFNAVSTILSMGIKTDTLNSKNLTPLAQTAISYFACKYSVKYIDLELHFWNYLIIIQELLLYGANPNVKIEIFDYNHHQSKHFFLLHGSCIERDITLTKFLLNSSQIQINMQDENLNTALHIACKNRDIRIMQLLLQSGCNTQLINQKEKSACAMILILHKDAQDEAHVEVLEKIIQKYLSVNATNYSTTRFC